MSEATSTPPVSLGRIAREWLRIGCVGFGGPPAHITLLRALCVDDYHWLSDHDFDDAIATTNLLPGPASTQLAIFCGWRLRGVPGALVAGISFIAPGLALILILADVWLARTPPQWIVGAAAGAGAAVPAVALRAAWTLVVASRDRMRATRAQPWRWVAYCVVGLVVGATAGELVVLALLACGVLELWMRRAPVDGIESSIVATSMLRVAPLVSVSTVASLAWVAFKVGALSYGGGFVIVPLMEHDAVMTYHWMTAGQFLGAVALGQITPGPVVQTVAVVGFAAAGIGGALLAAVVAFAPSFLFVIVGGPHFDRLRSNHSIQSFFAGSSAAVLGAIAGSALPLAMALQHPWQGGVLVIACLWFFLAKRGVVSALVGAGLLGVLAAHLGVAR